MPLTERELAILAVAVTKMQSIGFRPFNAEYFVEVASRFKHILYGLVVIDGKMFLNISRGHDVLGRLGLKT